MWHLILRSAAGQETETRTVRARALVNAAGPWVSETLARVVSVSSSRAVRLVKGSHFVVPRLFSHDFAYVFQNDDHRVVFAIPHEDDFTLIGTTEVEYTGDPYEARITEDEISYLCAAVNRYFRTPVDAEAIVWFFAGVRPLLDDVADDPSAVTRDYYLEIGQPPGKAPVLSVFGGKITTYRKLAEQALETLKPVLGFTAGSWTGGEPFPGSDIGDGGPDGFARRLRGQYGWLPEALARRYARTYGTRTHVLLDGIGSLKKMGRHFGCHLYEAKLRYVLAHEWAASAENVLWRRTKLGLRLDTSRRAALEAWIRKTPGPPADDGVSR